MARNKFATFKIMNIRKPLFIGAKGYPRTLLQFTTAPNNLQMHRDTIITYNINILSLLN